MTGKLFYFLVILGFLIFGEISSTTQFQQQAAPISTASTGGAIATADATTNIKGTTIMSGDGLAGTAGTGSSYAGSAATSLQQGLALAGATSTTGITLNASALGSQTIPGSETVSKDASVTKNPIQTVAAPDDENTSFFPNQQQQQQMQGLTCFPINWFNTKLKAIDVGASSSGDLYAVGVEGLLYHYDFVNNKWWKVDGDFELTNIVRVDTAYDGTPYVTTLDGTMYYLSCDNKWMKLPGCSKDVGVGKLGEVFKIGCDAREEGYGVYRLFCKNSCANCCGKGCNRHRRPVNVSPSEDSELLKNTKKCYWLRMSGSGVKIDVDPKGFPYVIKNNGELWGYEGEKKNHWFELKIQQKANDLTVSNDGTVFFSGEDKNIYRVIDDVGSTLQICGEGSAISAGPYSQPFVVGLKHKVMSSSKRGFN